ncbi:unnamed protein product [Strongylus vulgaris]|uniref:Uncharacterized protein n=1 Tax=Strongylus vulgaris TaxID=40348 RepID=A0A3P7J5W7_STRVU|nr:unnamed protein product [Strongylus vulgaris]
MKTFAAPRPDHVSADLSRAGGHRLHEILVEHLTSYLQRERIPYQWKISRTILFYKKGDREGRRNYRPICLLSMLYVKGTGPTSVEQVDPIGIQLRGSHPNGFEDYRSVLREPPFSHPHLR